MKIYKDFAAVYDRMMNNIPYDNWCDYIISLLSLNHVSIGDDVTELGCGTGTVTSLLSDAGLRMTGIDLSEDMLSIARRKNPHINFILQDMCTFTVDKKQKAVISVGDSMNYLLKKSQIYSAMKASYNALDKGGVFIFDLKTQYFFEKILGDKTYSENMGSFRYIWKNHYFKEYKIHKYGVKLFRQDATNANGKSSYEFHYQRAYSPDEIIRLAKMAGFRTVKVYDAFTFHKPTRRSERHYIVCKI
ncbi:MAG: class I SAM-dependent methyltransferase [Eubacterium sp.]|nr:class I SAM-dependent methyltransferase [Eubacterium sp.]